MRTFQLYSALILSSFLAMSCSQDDGNDQGDKGSFVDKPYDISPRAGKQTPQSQFELTVTNENGVPLAGAQILLGATGSQNDLLTTDQNGVFVAPASWIAPISVTLDKPGYIRATFLRQTPKGQKFVLRKSVGLQNLELKGINPGIAVQNKDGQVDFAMNTQALTRSDLFNFRADQMISNEVDIIEIAGQKADIPSNLGFPEQNERYLILNVKLNKPVFRMYFESSGPQKVFAMRGQFPVKPVFDGMRKKKELFELINFFNLKSGTLHDVVISQPTQNQDLRVDALNFDQKFSVRAPALATDEVLFVSAVGELSGWLVPTDLKQVESQQSVSISTFLQPQARVLAALKKKNEMSGPGIDRVSATLIDLGSSLATPTPLPLIESPRVQSAYFVHVPEMKTPKNLFPVAIKATLSQRIKQTKTNGNIVPRKNALWDIYGDSNLLSIELPQWPGDLGFTGELVWTLAHLASNQRVEVDLGPGMMNSVTHVSQASTDF